MTTRKNPGQDRAYHPGKTAMLIILSCGCKTRGRVVPRDNAYMTCDSGLAHGHRLRWLTATDNETGLVWNNRIHNPDYRKEKTP